MTDRQQYHASDGTWATASEVVVNDPVAGQQFNLPLRVEQQVPIEFAIFAVSTPTGDWGQFTDTRLDIFDSDFRSLALNSQSRTVFLSPDSKVAVLIRPHDRA